MDVLMPQLGETVAEGKISTWFKQVGDPVKPGDNLFEIETDKVSMEVPAIATGVLAEIRVPAGAVAPVGAVVAVLSLNNVLTTPQSTSATPQVVATGARRKRLSRRGARPRQRRVLRARARLRVPHARSGSIHSSKCAPPSAIMARHDCQAA